MSLEVCLARPQQGLISIIIPLQYLRVQNTFSSASRSLRASRERYGLRIVVAASCEDMFERRSCVVGVVFEMGWGLQDNIRGLNLLVVGRG
jgi:hypothetical protein